MKKLWFFLAMTVFVLASCSDGGSDDPVTPNKPEVVTPEITIDGSILSNGLSFDVAAGEKSVSFSVNADWTLSVASTTGGATWCKASATSGSKGTANVKFTVTENTEYDDRSVSVTIKAGTASKTFTITQKGADALLVTTTKYEVAQEGGQIEIEVKANIDYQMAISEDAKDWITEPSGRALTTHKHKLDIAMNEDAEKREGEIIFKSGDKVETVKVYQAGGALILLSQNEYTVSDAGETIEVDIKSNVEYGVQMPDVDWISDAASGRGMSSHTLKYVIAANEEYDSRSAEIIFYDKNSDLKDTLKVIQAQKDAIVISKKEYEVKAEGETIEVKLSANVDFEVTMPDVDWISQTESRGLTEHTLYFEVVENTSEEERSAEIVFTNTDSQLSEKISITQQGVFFLQLTENEYTVSDAGETIEVEVKSNVEYGIKMPEVDWITQDVSGRAVSAETLKFIVEANETYDSRSAEIVFYDKNSDLTDTLKVVQAQKNAIILSQKEYEVKAEGETIEVKLSANVDFEVTMPEVDWITQTESRGLTEYTLYFEVAKNEGEGKRLAEIVFKDKNSQASDKLTINQFGALEEGYANGVVTVATAGTMKKLLGDDYLNITSLKVIGFINGDDVYYLRRMLGGDNFDKVDWGKLTTLDLSEATIVEGGGWYNIAYGPYQKCYTSNNVIGRCMFHKCSNLQEIMLPNNAKKIAGDSFAYCQNFKSVSIGKDVAEIGYDAFYACKALNSVYITDLAAWCRIDFDNPDTPLSNGAKLYLNNEEVKNLIIPNEITEIKEYAFSGCESIEQITIGNNVSSIKDGAFGNCISLTKVHINNLKSWCQIDFIDADSNPLNGAKLYLNNEEVKNLTIPEELTEIKKYTFMGCKNIEKVTLGNEVTSIGEGAFMSCSALATINIHDDIVKIGSSAFAGCALTDLIIPDDVTSIGERAFASCSNLTSVVIGNGVARIEYGTFEDCYSLSSVKIGKNVGSVGRSAFKGASISEFYSYATTPPDLNGYNDWYLGLIHPFNEGIQKEAILYVPIRCKNVYEESSWSSFDGNVLFENIKEMD